MACLIINFYCDFLSTTFDQEIRKAIIIIDIEKVILTIKITTLLYVWRHKMNRIIKEYMMVTS